MSFRIFTFITLFTLTTITHASGNGVYGVKKVGCTTTNGVCWISLKTPISASINNCASGYETRFPLTDPGSNAVLSLALAAYASGKKLEIYIKDGADCISSYPKAIHVSITE